MGNIICFCFVFFVGFLGFLFFRRFKIPSPAFLGSILAAGILNAAGYYPAFDASHFSFIVKAATGVMLGRQINRTFFMHIKSIAVHVLLISAGMLAVSLVTGYTIYRMSDISVTTALIGGTTGGVAEMTAFGMSMQANAVVILFYQVFRLMFAIMLTPWTVRVIEKAVPGKTAKARLSRGAGEVFFRAYDYVPLAAVAFLGAWLLDALKIPNGIMMGGMLACGLLAVCVSKTYRFVLKARYITQIGLGVILGQSITPEVAGELHVLLLPGLVSSAVAVAGSLLLALLLYRFAPLDIITCVLCTSPAGVSQIAFLSDEMGADSLTTSIFQTCRLFSIIAFYPLIVTAIV